MNRIVATIAVAAALLSGCGEEPPKAPDEHVGETSQLLIDSLSNRDVILRVNDETFTKGDFLVAVRLADKIRRMCAGDPITGPNRAAEEYSRWVRPRTLSEIQKRSLMRQYAKKVGVSATKEEQDAYAAEILRAVRRGNSTLDAVAKEIGGEEGKLFRQNVLDDANDEPLRRFMDKDGILNITDADIMVVSNRMNVAREQCARSNAIERAELEAAIAEINAGEDFAEVAKRHSRDPEEGEFWVDTGLLEEMSESPELQKWMLSAKTGDVSGILEMNDSWSVVKVVSRKLEDLPPGSTAQPREVWDMVRISRNLIEKIPHPNREEFVQALLNTRNRTLQKRLGDAVMKEAVIEWPKGTNLFEKVSAKAAPGATQKK